MSNTPSLYELETNIDTIAAICAGSPRSVCAQHGACYSLRAELLLQAAAREAAHTREESRRAANIPARAQISPGIACTAVAHTAVAWGEPSPHSHPSRPTFSAAGMFDISVIAGGARAVNHTHNRGQTFVILLLAQRPHSKEEDSRQPARPGSQLSEGAPGAQAHRGAGRGGRTRRSSRARPR